MANSSERVSGATAVVLRSALRRVLPGRFFLGFVVGIVFVFAVRYTTIPNRLIAPLLAADTISNADVIVVPGAGIIGDCIPNISAIHRTLLAARLFHAGRAPILIISGGAPPGYACSIADVMARFAKELGVPQFAIRVETASHNTFENAEMTAPILRSIGARNILLVTDAMHMRRAAGVFAHQGFTVLRASVPSYATYPDHISVPFRIVRELAALQYYKQRGWLDPLDAGDRAHETGANTLPQNAAVSSATMVVLLGASYAQGWNPAPIGGMTVINKGQEGQQSWELLARFERDVIASRPRAVVIWGFINDIFRAPREKTDEASSRIRDSYTAMIAAARANGIEPILATEVTMGVPDSWSEYFASWAGWAMGKESYQDRINKQVLVINAWLRERAAADGLLLLDIHAALSDANGRRQKGFAKEDGSHISPAGYEALTKYASPVLARHLDRR